MPARLRYVLAAALLLAGGALLARPWWTGVEERNAQRQLAARYAAASPADPAPLPPETPSPARPSASALPGLPVWTPPGPPPPVFARLDIPAIGLGTYVVRGATLTDYESLLAWGPAHLKGSAEPGQEGNVVIFGHVDEFGAPFRHLDRLRPGDPVTLAAGGRSFAYRVQRVWVVPPADTSVVEPLSGVRALTLFTCTGPANAERLVVRAVAASPPGGAPTGPGA